MVYTIAAYHDIGHYIDANNQENDKPLKKEFIRGKN